MNEDTDANAKHVSKRPIAAIDHAVPILRCGASKRPLAHCALCSILSAKASACVTCFTIGLKKSDCETIVVAGADE